MNWVDRAIFLNCWNPITWLEGERISRRYEGLTYQFKLRDGDKLNNAAIMVHRGG